MAVVAVSSCAELGVGVVSSDAIRRSGGGWSEDSTGASSVAECSLAKCVCGGGGDTLCTVVHTSKGPGTDQAVSQVEHPQPWSGCRLDPEWQPRQHPPTAEKRDMSHDFTALPTEPVQPHTHTTSESELRAPDSPCWAPPPPPSLPLVLHEHTHNETVSV